VLKEESECAIVAFNPKLSGESAAAEDVGVCEWGLAFGACEGRVVLFLHLWRSLKPKA